MKYILYEIDFTIFGGKSYEKIRQKLKEERARQNNRGLTLIELIVTFAIIAIFSGVVMTFIMTEQYISKYIQ